MKPESKDLFNEFRLLTDRSEAVANRLEKLQENLKWKINSDDYQELCKIWDEMYDLYLDHLMMQSNLIDNLK